MDFLRRGQEFDLSDDELHELEEKARANLGNEQYEKLVEGIRYEVMRSAGTGDLPPGYDPETDPLRKRERHTARNILLGLLGAGLLGGAAAIVYKQKSTESKENS